MTWHSHTIVLCLWCPQPVVQSVVAAIFWRRKLHKQFPGFFLFLLAQVANFAVIFPLWVTGNQNMYFKLFWLGEAINAVLGFKVIHEVFLDVFRPYHTLKDLGTLLFKWAGVVMLLVSLVVAFANSFDRNLLWHVLTALQRSVRIVQLGLILFLLLFSRFLGVSRKQVSFGISLGFGLFAGVELLLFAFHSGGLITLSYLNLINMATYNLAIFVWLGYSLSRKAVRVPAVNHLQTQRWEQGLADIQHPTPSDSLIPMFEGMVERAFSRSSNLEAAELHIPLNRPGNPARANSAAAGSKTGT
jgi:heme exporter protein D